MDAADNQHGPGADDRDGADDDRENRLVPREADSGVHRPISGCGVPRCFVRLAREALHEAYRRERFVQPLDESRLELFHALLAVEQRGDVVTDRQVQERHDCEGQERDRDVELQENCEHHDQRRDGGQKR